MKVFILFVLMITFSGVAGAKKKATTEIQATPETKNLQLKTDANFTSGANVLGNYENMSEADVAIEGEKKRIDIVEPRKNWDLKTKVSKEWH